MNITRRVKVKRGVALIFALFTIAVLFSIGTTVVALSLHDSRTTRVVNYNEAALHAANWGIEAAINYMGQPGIGFNPDDFNIGYTGRRSQWVNTKAYTYNGGNYNYPYGRQLVLTKNIGGNKTALNNDVWIEVSSLDSNTLKSKYGLEYDTTKTLGEDKWCANYTGTDLAAGGGTGNNRDGSDSRLISFKNPSGGDTYRLNYGQRGDNYAEVEVVCTEFRYPHSNQPSQYQLLSIAKIYANDGVNSDKVPLATRVVDARVRESMACDFMHFIQNARSWDALGVNLGQSNSDYDRKTEAGREIARSSVFLPEGYLESGRLRVDGYGNASNKDPENNPVKKYLNDRGFDGKLGFFSNSSTFTNSNYTFQGDVTTARSSKDYEYKPGKGSLKPKNLDSVKGVFSGSLRDGTPSLGLPQADNYFEYATAKAKDHTGNNGTHTINISIGSNSVNNRSDYDYVKSHYGKNGNGKCPDIAQAMTQVSDGKGGMQPIGSAVPTFATVRVEICGDKARIVKYNSAMTKNGVIDNDYVEDLTSQFGGTNSIDIAKINNGVINVTGGNVEVVNVKKFASKGTGLSTDYIDVKNNTNECLDGALTIVSNVNEARDISLNNVGSSNPKPGGSALYSDVARAHYDENPYVNVPPFSQKELGIGSSTAKSIWPTPQSSALEREGNVILASDIAYKSSSNSSPSLGIVAKNYILLNDKSLNSKRTPSKQDVLRVDAVLMSMDHSVQFDWNNMAANNATLNYGGGSYRGESEKGKTLYQALTSNREISNKGAGTRTFQLNGAIVSGFLDVEGDTNGRGFYSQNFKHDENLRYNLPPIFPRWKVGEFAERGVFGDWMITAYEDKGAISDM